MSRVRKKFGLANDKFIDSINQQFDHATQTQRIEIKTIPISSISFEPGNPRKLKITPQDIRDSLPTLQLPPAALEEYSDKDWETDYETLVNERFGEGKKKDDFMAVVKLAAGLKSADRLLHPITVWREETRFFKITGERRLLAHILLGETHIRATIREQKPGPFELKRIQYQENVLREDLDLAETLDALEGMLEEWRMETGEHEISIAQFQNIADMSQTQAQRYRTILFKGSENLRTAINDRKIVSLRKAFELAAMGSPQDDAFLAQVLAGDNHMPAKEIQRERARQGKATRNRGARSGARRAPNFVNPTLVRRMREADTKAMEKMVTLLRNAIKGSEADQAIENLKLDKPRDVTAAFQKIFEYFKQHSEKGKG